MKHRTSLATVVAGLARGPASALRRPGGAEGAAKDDRLAVPGSEARPLGAAAPVDKYRIGRPLPDFEIGDQQARASGPF